jgi:hypothetical protein
MKFLLILTFVLPTICFSQQTDWFSDAKLGIFIHWGMYAVDGTSESWAFHNKTIPYPKYMSQMNGFSAQNYNPGAWAQLIKESGAKYCVITTKHHDGLALYDTKLRTATPQQPTEYNLSNTNKKRCYHASFPSLGKRRRQKRGVLFTFRLVL